MVCIVRSFSSCLMRFYFGIIFLKLFQMFECLLIAELVTQFFLQYIDCVLTSFVLQPLACVLLFWQPNLTAKTPFESFD